MTPKQIAVLDGKVVARTYDCDSTYAGDFALKFEPNEEKFGDYNPINYIFRMDYFKIRKCVEKTYRNQGTIEWRDASQYG